MKYVSPYRAFEQNLKAEYRSERRTEIHPALNSSHSFFVPSIKAMNRGTILKEMKNIWLRDESRWARQ